MNDLLIQFFASFFLWMLFAGVLILWIKEKKTDINFIISLAFSSTAAWLITVMIKNLFPTIRPFYIEGIDPLTLTIPTDAAYPSTHTAVAFAVALTILLKYKKTGLVYILGAVIIGIARILADVHTILDVFGGILIGIASALIIARLNFSSLTHASKST